MYQVLYRRVGHQTAMIVTALWYALALFAIYFCSFAPPAEFRYMEL